MTTIAALLHEEACEYWSTNGTWIGCRHNHANEAARLAARGVVVLTEERLAAALYVIDPFAPASAAAILAALRGDTDAD